MNEKFSILRSPIMACRKLKNLIFPLDFGWSKSVIILINYYCEFPHSFQFPALREFVEMGKPVWGTCAGLIFLANKATGNFYFSSSVTVKQFNF